MVLVVGVNLKSHVSPVKGTLQVARMPGTSRYSGSSGIILAQLLYCFTVFSPKSIDIASGCITSGSTSYLDTK